MSFLALLLVAFGVSADAFAVAVGKGLGMRRPHLPTAVALAAAFGAAQALMPVLGWALASQLERFITSFDHWVAFSLLVVVGARMLREAVTGRAAAAAAAEAVPAGGGRGLLIRPRELAVLAVATSIDALAVGISLAIVDVSIVVAAVMIGVVTFAVCLAGVGLGYRAGAHWRRPAEVAGGLILIGIGVKILLDHLGAG